MKRLSLPILSCFIMVAIMGPSSFADKKVLHAYTSLDAQEAPVYTKKFEEKTGIEVKWVRLSAGETLARLEAEKNNPQVSIWFGGPSPEFMIAKQKGLLARYEPKLDYKINVANRDLDWNWVGFYFGAIGFGLNQDFFKSKNLSYPETWDDLLKPEFKGKISMAYPYTSGTAYTVVAALLEKYGEEKGWEYIKKLDGQVHHYNKSGSAAVTQAGLGEVAVGISFSHDILKKGKDSGYPVALSVPKDGTATEIGAMALVKGGKEEALAKQFMDYILSVEGQNLLVEFRRVPLNPKAKVAEGAITASKIKLIAFDSKKAADRQKEILDKWRKVTSR
jgi:iron(III) transport system substrate-binding protein